MQSVCSYKLARCVHRARTCARARTVVRAASVPTYVVGRPQKQSVPRGVLTSWLSSEANCAECAVGVRRAPWGSTLPPWEPAGLRPSLWASADPSTGLLLGVAAWCLQDGLTAPPLAWVGVPSCHGQHRIFAPESGLRGSGRPAGPAPVLLLPTGAVQTALGPAQSLPGVEPAWCCPPVPEMSSSLGAGGLTVFHLRPVTCGALGHGAAGPAHTVSHVLGLLPPPEDVVPSVPAAASVLLGAGPPPAPWARGALTRRREALMGALAGCRTPCGLGTELLELLLP